MLLSRGERRAGHSMALGAPPSAASLPRPVKVRSHSSFQTNNREPELIRDAGRYYCRAL